MGRVLPVLRAFSLILAMFGATMLVPLAVSWLLKDGAHFAYDEAFVVTGAVAATLWLLSHRQRRELQIKDGFLLVVLTWTLLPAFASLPLLVFFWPKLSFTDAYFEAVSGVTTTGATVLSGLDSLPYSINLWRAELVWLGGMGLIVLAVAILPLLGVGGRQMFKAETPGPMKESKLTPRMAHTAKGLWLIYGGISLACLLARHWAGMAWGDALIHTFTTMGLGGFSNHDASFAYFGSVRIELVTILFMTLAGMNFATHFLAWRGRNLTPYRYDPEILWFLVVMYGSVPIVAWYLWQKGAYPDFPAALRFSAFNVVSIATTTGYASTDYSLWPHFAPLWMLFLCSFATCSGSTGGGIKMIRANILFKHVFREIVRATHPTAVRPIKVGGETLPGDIVFAVLAYGFMYMVIVATLTLLLSYTGLESVTAFSAVVATFNNTGPALNEVGPASNYACLSDFQTWVCTFAMLLGRLEIFTLLVVLTPSFWSK
jgi:trk system potassium uptake protein TrkH